MSIRRELSMLVTIVAAVILLFAGLAQAAATVELLKIHFVASLTGPGSQMQMAQRFSRLCARTWEQREGWNHN